MIWYLLEILENRAGYTPAKLNDILMKLLMGSKKKVTDDVDWPTAVNVKTFVERLERKIPGFHAAYDTLSEYAHPNWHGVAGLYSKDDRPNFEVQFGRGVHAERAGGQLVNALTGGLMTFESGYYRIADLMPAFLAELEKL